jgi:hypothetical protein
MFEARQLPVFIERQQLADNLRPLLPEALVTRRTMLSFLPEEAGRVRSRADLALRPVTTTNKLRFSGSSYSQFGVPYPREECKQPPTTRSIP